MMIRSCDLILCSFFVGLTLSASAQQSTPAASAPAPLVGTLAGHPDWPEAKNPGDVDTGTTWSLRSMTWSPAQLDSATGIASARCLCPTVGLPGLIPSLRPQRCTGTQG